MAEVLPVEQKQAEQKPDEMDTYLAEKEEFVDASEEASCTPSAHSDSQTDVSKGKENTAPKAQQNDDGPIYTLPAYPLPQCTPKPRPELTADQRKKYDALLLHVKSWTHVPKTSHKNAETEPLTDEDRLWLTHECLLRYLRATSWHSADAAAKRLLATLTWRREYGLAKFTPEYISIENETGKQTIFGFDNDGRPCLYMSPSKQNTAKSDRQLHHLVFMLERLIDIMPAGQETNALLINFKDSSSGKNPSVSQGRQTLNILQGHYPERLGRALISELPWYVTTFFRLISPFIDPVTKEKMKFNEPLSRYVPASHLKREFGGDADFQYNHDVYWPALCDLAAKRRKDYVARWEKAGKHIGEHEAFLRGGDAKCFTGLHSGSDFPEGFSHASEDAVAQKSEMQVEEKSAEIAAAATKEAKAEKSEAEDVKAEDVKAETKI